MPASDKSSQYDSLIRHNFGFPILEFVSNENNPVNFSLLMEKLKISKRALYMTLKDLESEDLIMQTKVGRKSIISITNKGKEALLFYSLSKEDQKQNMYKSVIETTVKQLENEGIISKDWSPRERSEFIKKLSDSIYAKL